MYQLILSSSSAQSTVDAIDAFFTRLMVVLGGFYILAFIIPIGIALAIRVSLGLLSSILAGEKGYNKFGFFWYGFFYFPFAVGVAILAPPLNNSQDSKPSSTELDKEELARYEEMYEAGTLSWTQFCQKKEEILQRGYRK